MQVSIDTALYDISFANLALYSATIPTYEAKENKGGAWETKNTTGKTEKFGGFAAFMQRMKEIKKSGNERK